MSIRASSAGQALLVIATIALVQAALLAGLLAFHAQSAHVIDVSGAQRMRSQRIAFLVLAAHVRAAPADWRAELHGAIALTRDTRRTIFSQRWAVVGEVGPDGLAPLGRLTETFLRAAEAFARDPHDNRALHVVLANRTGLLTAFDAAVRTRTERVRRYDELLVLALALGSFAFLGVVLLMWWRVVQPAEAATNHALVALAESRDQLTSLFQQNPSPIAVYDLEGRVVRGNRAAVALLGYPPQALLGQHYTRHMMDPDSAETADAFARAVRGETVRCEGAFRAAGDVAVEVALTVFPNVVDGVVVGVIGVAQDIRALRAARAATDEQTDRIAELYRLAASHGGTWAEQMSGAVRLATDRLGFEWGALTRVSDGRLTVDVVTGAPPDLVPGTEYAEQGTFSRFVLDRGTLCEVGDVETFARRELSATPARSWGALLGLPVVAGDAIYGVLVLGSAQRRPTATTEADRDFLRLVAALLGSALVRARQESKLDALAFFDALTGLPNRVLLNDRLAELVLAAERHDAGFAVHYIDLDRFKAVNDEAGHAAGDEVLRLAAERMQRCLRATDTVARLGGDEFVILQPTTTGHAGAAELAARIIAAFRVPFVVAGREHDVGASVGTALYPEHGRTASALLECADEALYRAKQAGRDRLAFVRVNATH